MQSTEEYVKEEQKRQRDLVTQKIERYLNNNLFRAIIRNQNKLILNFMTEEDVILEVGCGYGNLLADVMSKIPSNRVIGMDISYENLKLGRERILKIKSNLFQGMLEGIPVKDDVIDVSVMRGVLHHLSDPDLCLYNLSKVIKKDGYLIILEGDPQARYRKLILGISDILGIKHEASQFPHLPAMNVVRLLQSKFTLIAHHKISSLWTPLAFMGNFMGDAGIYLENLNQWLQKTTPDIFNWWYMLVFQKK